MMGALLERVLHRRHIIFFSKIMTAFCSQEGCDIRGRYFIEV